MLDRADRFGGLFFCPQKTTNFQLKDSYRLGNKNLT
nr:MAG TPA: hypothetical protein [Caudoviricetes sp.]